MSDRGKSSDADRDLPRGQPADGAPQPARRSDPLKVLLLFALAAMLLYHFVGNLPHDAVPSAVTWQADMSKAVSLASSSGKVIFADFYADWCGPCREMDHDVFSDKPFARALEQLAVPLRIDLTQPPGQQLAGKYDVDAIPAFIVLSADGAVLARGTGTRTADELLSMVKQAASKASPATQAQPR